MKSVSLSSPRHLAGSVKPSALDGMARRIVLRQLERLEAGTVRLTDGPEELRFGAGGAGAPVAHIQVRDPRFYSEIAFGGSIGGGEAYMHGLGLTVEAIRQVRGTSPNQVRAGGGDVSMMIAGPMVTPVSSCIFGSEASL